MQEMQVQSLGWEDALEKETVTHSSILAWEILRTEKLVGYRIGGRKRVKHNLVTKQQQQGRQMNINLNFILYMSEFKMDHTDAQQAYEKMLITANC